KRLLRGNIHWPTAFALRVLRVPIGLACARWLISRRSLSFAVTPKGGSAGRSRGRSPAILLVLIALTSIVCGYAAAGVADLVPWQAPARSTVAAGLWLILADAVLVLGLLRIRAPRYATSRRNAPRIAARARVLLNGEPATLID